MNDFENQRKWCSACEADVAYLRSAMHSYCVHCDGKVRLYIEPVIPLPGFFFEYYDIPHYTDRHASN